MSLSDHARATRIMADSFTEAGDEVKRKARNNPAMMEAAGTLIALALGFEKAANRMEAEVRADAAIMADGHRCSVDHASITTSRCAACGAPRG